MSYHGHAFDDQRKAAITSAETAGYQGLMHTVKKLQRVDKAWVIKANLDDPLRLFTVEKKLDEKNVIIISLWHRIGKRRHHGDHDPARYFDVYRVNLAWWADGKCLRERKTNTKPVGRGIIPKLVADEAELKGVIQREVQLKKEQAAHTLLRAARLKAALGPYYMPSPELRGEDVGLDLENGKLVLATRSWRSCINVSVNGTGEIHMQMGMDISPTKVQRMLSIIEEAV